MRLITKARYNGELTNSENWAKVDKIKWTNVPANVGTVLKILCPIYYNGSYHDEDHYLPQLAGVSLPSLASTRLYLDEHTTYLFTHKGNTDIWYDGRQFKIAAQPLVCYSRNYSARGLASTYRNNSFLVSDKTISFLDKAIARHTNLVDDAKRKKFTGFLQQYVRRTNDAEKKSRSHYMDEYQIALAALSTFTSYRNGQSKSTLGDWSFGLSYSTHYIGEDGELLPFDEEKVRDNWLDKIESLEYPALIESGMPLVERNVELQRVFYQRSQMWHKVMHDIHNAIYNVYSQYHRNLMIHLQEEE